MKKRVVQAAMAVAEAIEDLFEAFVDAVVAEAQEGGCGEIVSALYADILRYIEAGCTFLEARLEAVLEDLGSAILCSRGRMIQLEA